MQLAAGRAQERRAGREVADESVDGPALEVGRPAARLAKKEQARGRVEDPDGDRSAEDVECSGGGERYRERHRAQYADLGGALDKRPCDLQRPRRALEAEQLDALPVGPGRHGERLAA